MDKNDLAVCIYCFEKKTDAAICSHCKWPEIEETKDIKTDMHLPPGTVLNNKYMTGKVLGHDEFGITAMRQG